MKKTIVTGLWALLLTSLLTLPAFAQELIVGGQAVGIQISTDGVLVAGLCEVDGSGGSRPAESAGLKTGDRIVAADGVPVSSTQVRGALAAGRVEAAADMLGYRYPLRGVVVEGNRLGRTIGFPTANMQLFEPRKMVPADGVYYVAVETLGRRLDGMCNIGVRPTVGAASGRTIETHVFDFDESIYGLDFRVSFLRRIRDERKFSSLDELRVRLAADREECLRFRFRDV